MENTLSIKDYINQRKDNAFCESIARGLCEATKRAWDAGKFSTTKIQPIVKLGNGSSESKSCDGTRIDFRLTSEVITTEYDKGYGTIEHIKKQLEGDSPKGINVDEIQKAMLLHNQDWSTVTKFYFKHLHEYLDLSGVYLLSRHISRARFDKYVDYGTSTTGKCSATESLLYQPQSVDGEGVISLCLLVVSNRNFNEFIKDLAAEDTTEK